MNDVYSGCVPLDSLQRELSFSKWTGPEGLEQEHQRRRLCRFEGRKRSRRAGDGHAGPEASVPETAARLAQAFGLSISGDHGGFGARAIASSSSASKTSEGPEDAAYIATELLDSASSAADEQVPKRWRFPASRLGTAEQAAPSSKVEPAEVAKTTSTAASIPLAGAVGAACVPLRGCAAKGHVFDDAMQCRHCGLAIDTFDF